MYNQSFGNKMYSKIKTMQTKTCVTSTQTLCGPAPMVCKLTFSNISSISLNQKINKPQKALLTIQIRTKINMLANKVYQPAPLIPALIGTHSFPSQQYCAELHFVIISPTAHQTRSEIDWNSHQLYVLPRNGKEEKIGTKQTLESPSLHHKPHLSSYSSFGFSVLLHPSKRCKSLNSSSPSAARRVFSMQRKGMKLNISPSRYSQRPIQVQLTSELATPPLQLGFINAAPLILHLHHHRASAHQSERASEICLQLASQDNGRSSGMHQLSEQYEYSPSHQVCVPTHYGELVINYLYQCAIQMSLPYDFITDIDILHHNPLDIVPSEYILTCVAFVVPLKLLSQIFAIFGLISSIYSLTYDILGVLTVNFLSNSVCVIFSSCWVW